MTTIKKIREHQVRYAVLEHYLETGSGLDLKEIAAKVGISDGTARRYIQTEEGRLLRGLMVSTYGRDPTHFPSQAWLRQIVLEQRAITGNAAAIEILSKITDRVGQ